MNLFKTNTVKNYYEPTHGDGEVPRKPKNNKKELEDNIIKDIRKLFLTKQRK